MDISVIIPVYNVKEYLGKAVESLEKQHIDEMEIILVDDGSTDGTDIVVDSLANKYGNVQAIHQANAGAAEARNNGINRSKGKYLYFMDPDDWMEEFMLSHLYRAAEEHGAQLVIAGFTNEYFINGKYFSTKVELTEHTFSQNDFRRYSPILLNNTTLAVPWNKLYLASFIKDNDLKFPSVKWDDLHFNMDVTYNIKKVVTINDCSYHFYRTRPGSETTKVFDGRLFENRKKQFEHVLSNYKAWGLFHDTSVMSSVYYYYASRIVQVIQELSDTPQLNMREKISTTKNIIRDQETRDALAVTKDGSFLMKSCFLVLKSKLAVSSLIMGWGISLVKNKFSNLFYSMRVSVMKK